MILSIYTDASHSPHTNDCGYAIWTECYQFSQQYGNYLPGCHNSTTAELHAINHAVESLLSVKLCPMEGVKIYTDSLEAISKIQQAKHPAFFSLIELTQKNGMRAKDVFKLFTLQHVKAHTKNLDEASNKNHWCDYQAKSCRRTKSEFKAIIYDNTDLLI